MEDYTCREYQECRANRPCEHFCRLWWLTLGGIHCRDFEIAKQERQRQEESDHEG